MNTPDVVATIDREISAFEDMKAELERHHRGKWAVVHNRELVGTFDNIDNAASFAVKTFGRGPYLIRQIGAPPISLPISVFTRSQAA
jgi:hypothetical protein